MPALRASVIPTDGLDTYTITANFDTGFVKVAMIHFEDEPVGKYADPNVWGFTKASVRENVLSIKHISGTTWQAMVDGVPRNLKVTRTDHSGGHIVGTARWAWSDKDEAIWVRCEDGCCLVEPM